MGSGEKAETCGHLVLKLFFISFIFVGKGDVIVAILDIYFLDKFICFELTLCLFLLSDN